MLLNSVVYYRALNNFFSFESFFPPTPALDRGSVVTSFKE